MSVPGIVFFHYNTQKQYFSCLYNKSLFLSNHKLEPKYEYHIVG